MSLQNDKNFSNTQNINYFEYMYNLKKFQNRIFELSTIEQFELLYLEVITYFDCHYELKIWFKEQLDIFLKTKEVAGDFESIYWAEYEKIKEITSNITKESNVSLKYYNKRFFYSSFNKENIIRGIGDIPILYLYPSISCSKLTRDFKPKQFLISDSFINMYTIFDYRYHKINIPKNIEFYVVISLSYMHASKSYSKTCISKNICCYYATALNYVLAKMQETLKNKIINEYFDENSIRINNETQNQVVPKYILTFRKDKNFYINGKLFNLSLTLNHQLETILIRELTPKIYNMKNYVYRINQQAKKQIGQPILRHAENGRYSLIDNILLKNYEDKDKYKETSL